MDFNSEHAQALNNVRVKWGRGDGFTPFVRAVQSVHLIGTEIVTRFRTTSTESEDCLSRKIIRFSSESVRCRNFRPD